MTSAVKKVNGFQFVGGESRSYELPKIVRRKSASAPTCFKPISLASRRPRGSNSVQWIILSSVAAIACAFSVVAVSLNGSARIVHSANDYLRSSSLSSTLSSSNGKLGYLNKLSFHQKKIAAGKVSFLSDVIRKTRTQSKQFSLAKAIVVESLRLSYDPLLVASIIQSESTFRTQARSNKGAMGLMQLVPTTAKYTANLSGLTWSGYSKLYEPSYNIQVGVAYLKYLEEYFDGNMRHALMAYNWGPSNLSSALRSGQRIPSSVQNYADKILARHQVWQEKFSGRLEALRFIDPNKFLG